MTKTIKGHNPGYYQADNPDHVKIWTVLEENLRLSSQFLKLKKEEIHKIVMFAGRCLRKSYERHLKLDENDVSFLIFDGHRVAMAIPGTDLKDVFTFASDALEDKCVPSINEVIGRELDADSIQCILHRFHASIAMFIDFGEHFIVDKSMESEIKCLGRSLFPAMGEFTNLNTFSNSVLNWFHNTINSNKD